jgi:hypothetical protein
MGMDYVVENNKNWNQFNKQLGEAYNGLGWFKKRFIFLKNQLLKKKSNEKEYMVLLALVMVSCNLRPLQ